jgi:FlaA1/EpsC-like NDP-sugar epimerase
MEAQPDEAVKNNIFGTKIVIDASIEQKVEKCIFISTDKAVNPTSVMGSTKRIGEMMCQAYNQKNITKFISVRFGNVLNSRGSVIPIFKEQIRKMGPVEVTHPDMRRYFMLNSEACLLVMQAGAMGQGGEVFVLDMGKPIKILDLAREMIRLSGFQPDKDIAIIFSGMRPGEKLFEEILTAQEGVVTTHNQKIYIAKMSQVSIGDIEGILDDLKNMIYKDGREKIVAFLAAVVNRQK